MFNSGVTPLSVQYSGRHISHWNVNELKTELLAAVSIGRIQSGPKAAPNPQVIVPAFAGPGAAAGIWPIAPGTVTALLAARAGVPALASAAPVAASMIAAATPKEIPLRISGTPG